MRFQKISFPKEEIPCVFPNDLPELAPAVSLLELDGGHPVIVLIGDEKQEHHAFETHRALETLARIAEDTQALVICGALDAGFMADIGQIRHRNAYSFPLVGMAPEGLVTWTDGPHTSNFPWFGKKRQFLAPNYSHFILVPGSEFKDVSAWMMEAASILSMAHPSVTILVNGGDLLRNDVRLSVEKKRPVTALGGAGNLANELASEPDRHNLISVIPANDENRIRNTIQALIHSNLNGTSADHLAAAEEVLLRETADQLPVGQAPTIISKRDESKPINAEKSERQIPETFIK